VSLRRALLVALTAWVAGVTAASAAPHEFHARQSPRRLSAITFSPLGSGTAIRLTYAGRARPLVRVIESVDPIDALTMADVDNDGDLDILASARDGQLMLWRNAGNGQFRLAAAPPHRIVTARAAHIGRCHHVDAPIQAGDDRYDAAMPRAPAVTAADPVPARFAVNFVCVPVPARQRPSGRAPPLHA
jgi:VCBS repeat protein